MHSHTNSRENMRNKLSINYKTKGAKTLANTSIYSVLEWLVKGKLIENGNTKIRKLTK